MRAVVVEKTGGPDALQVVERPIPEPGPGQVVVDVAASGVNFIDVYQRTGVYPMELPFLVGSEGAGTVTAVGDGVDDVKVGDRVAWGQVDGGGYAETVVLPADRFVPVPDGVELETAAAAMLQGMTAHYLCESTFVAGPEHTALLHAAAGGAGLLLTQMLAHYIADRAELLQRANDVLGAVAEDRLDVRIGGRYPLAEAARAHEDLEARRTTGKLLVLPRD